MNKETLQETISTCLNEGRHLTKWERSFLFDMEDRLVYGRTLSEREEEIVMQIYKEKADG